MSSRSSLLTMNPLEDPLERDDFDSVAYINQIFPTGKRRILLN